MTTKMIITLELENQHDADVISAELDQPEAYEGTRRIPILSVDVKYNPEPTTVKAAVLAAMDDWKKQGTLNIDVMWGKVEELVDEAVYEWRTANVDAYTNEEQEDMLQAEVRRNI